MPLNQTLTTNSKSAGQIGKVKSNPLKPPTKQPSSIEILRERISTLVKSDNPLDPSLLPVVYKETYGSTLNFKSFGYTKLLKLVETIPTVEIVRHRKKDIPSVVLVFKAVSVSFARVKPSQTCNETSPPRTETRKNAPGSDRVNTVVPSGTNKPVGAPHSPSISSIEQHATEKGQSAQDESSPHANDIATNVAVQADNHSSPVDAIGNRTTASDDAITPGISSLSAVSFLEYAAKKSTKPSSVSDDGDITHILPKMDQAQSCFSVVEPTVTKSMAASRASLGDRRNMAHIEEMAFLGSKFSPDDRSVPLDPVFLNTHEPFCLVTVGIQGAGKSHTLSCALESCLLEGAPDDVIRLKQPMTALVLHYDQSTTSICEAAGLLTPSPVIPKGLPTPHVPQDRATILVSSTFYKQRKAFYGDYCTVRPLLFEWSTLTADHIKRIMGITPSDNQLYVASFMTLLRKYQRRAIVPHFPQFLEEVKEVCNVRGQSGPLDQRIALLESVVAESQANTDIKHESMDIKQAMSSGMDLIIVDLTDPLLTKEEANGLFQVVTEQFRSAPSSGGKLLALDEAHKFMDGTQGNDGLSQAIVNVARLMRHDGIRLVVSTQSPKALAPELLELVSVAVLHHFHSQDWWNYLCQKLPIPRDAWETILSLGPGNALVFASRSSDHIFPVAIRRRLTADFGGSRTNT